MMEYISGRKGLIDFAYDIVGLVEENERLKRENQELKKEIEDNRKFVQSIMRPSGIDNLVKHIVNGDIELKISNND